MSPPENLTNEHPLWAVEKAEELVLTHLPMCKRPSDRIEFICLALLSAYHQGAKDALIETLNDLVQRNEGV